MAATGEIYTRKVEALRWAAWHGDLDAFAQREYDRAKERLTAAEAELDGNGSDDA